MWDLRRRSEGVARTLAPGGLAPIWRRFVAVLRKRRVDIAIAGGLATLGALIAVVSLRRYGLGDFYQTQYEPAVRFACGHGFENFRASDAALETFLSAKDGSYTCAPKPSGGTSPLVYDQAVSRYLQLTVGMLWRVLGVSWASVTPLFAALAATTAATLYGIARLLLPRIGSAAVTALLVCSPLHLEMIPHLRDYSKAPFLLGSFLLIALLLRRRPQRPTALTLSVMVGLCVGLGYGFRSDIILVVPLYLVVIVLFWPGGPQRDAMTRALACVAFLGTIAIVSAPVRADVPEGGNTAHWAILGLGTRFTEALGLEEGIYDLGYAYNDTYVTSLVNAHAHHVEEFDGPVTLTSPEAERYGMRLLLDTGRTFPADLVSRGQAATSHVTNLPLETIERTLSNQSVLPSGMASWLARLSEQRWLGPLIVVSALLAAGAQNIRLALAAGFAVLYLGAASALQYDLRHVFHLEGVTVLAGAYLLSLAARCGPSAWRNRHRWREAVHKPGFLHGTRSVLAMLAALLFATFGLLFPARAYQDDEVRDLFNLVTALPHEEIRLEPIATDGGTTLLQVPGKTVRGASIWEGTSLVRSAYLVASFSASSCADALTPVVWRYRSTTDYTDYTTTELLPLGSSRHGDIDVYLVAFQADDFALEGIELPPSAVSCLQELSVVRKTDRLPLLTNATLTDDWASATLHQTFSFEPRQDPLNSVPELVSSMPGAIPDLTGRPVPLNEPSFAAPGLETLRSAWRYRGRPATAAGYLAASREFRCPPAGQVTVSGELHDGRVAVGIQQADSWVDVVQVREEGDFVAVVKSPPTGSCKLVLANSASAGSQTSVDVRRAAASDAP